MSHCIKNKPLLASAWYTDLDVADMAISVKKAERVKQLQAGERMLVHEGDRNSRHRKFPLTSLVVHAIPKPLPGF